MFETNFSEHNKIWEAQKRLGVHISTAAQRFLTIPSHFDTPIEQRTPVRLHSCRRSEECRNTIE